MKRMASRQSEPDRFVAVLRQIIDWAVRALAVLMVFVIVMGVADVVWVLYQRLLAPPVGLLGISDILQTFGAFLAVLIAIEIFVNITVYLRRDVIHVEIVMATALMAVARKLIVLDFAVTPVGYVYGLAAATLAASVGYWLAVRTPGPARDSSSEPPEPPDGLGLRRHAKRAPPAEGEPSKRGGGRGD